MSSTLPGAVLYILHDVPHQLIQIWRHEVSNSHILELRQPAGLYVKGGDTPGEEEEAGFVIKPL